MCEERETTAQWEGGLYLVAQPSVECYSGAHVAYAIVGWALTLLWVIGMPFLMSGMLVRTHRRLRYVGSSRSMMRYPASPTCVRVTCSANATPHRKLVLATSVAIGLSQHHGGRRSAKPRHIVKR